MKLQEIREEICYNMEGNKIPENCSCDNCFYRRTPLALEIMRLMGLEMNYLLKHTKEF